MAIRLNFIVEGQTEEAFVKQILSPYLAGREVWAQARCVLTSRRRNIKHRGGIKNYEKARNDINAWIREDRNSDVRFTTMFDMYGLPTNFPGYLAQRPSGPRLLYRLWRMGAGTQPHRGLVAGHRPSRGHTH